MEAGKNSLRKIEGEKALHYLKKIRGFSDEIIDKFEFGYCPSNIDHQLRDRIIIPIYDVYNNLVAVSSRYIEKDRLNRFWHESFDKGSYLYGLCYAKKDIIKSKKAILVEGEFDVAFLHTHGINIAVGACGSSFTMVQTSILSRWCEEIYIIFDGDEPGKNSIKRVMKLKEKYDLDAYKLDFIPVFLPGNTDPDEYVRDNGIDKFRNLLIKSRKNKEAWEINL